MSFYHCGTCGSNFVLGGIGEPIYCPQCNPRKLTWRTVIGGVLRYVADYVDTPPVPANVTYRPWGSARPEA